LLIAKACLEPPIRRAAYLTPNIYLAYAVILLFMTAKFSQGSDSASDAHQTVKIKKIALPTNNYVVECSFLDSNHSFEKEVALIDRLFGHEIAALWR
jgi:hypothetical protein